jgi:hypothetical protein
MSEAEQRILQMLEDGIISAEEANNLLTALGPGERAELVGGDPVVVRDPASDGPKGPPPDLKRFRRLWGIPVFIAVGSLILSGLGLVLMYLSARDVAALGFLCVWSIFLLALATTALFLVARRAPWLYVHIEEHEGTRINFAIPVPWGLIGWMVRVSRPFVPAEQMVHLETAAAIAMTMRDNPNADPIIVDVDDEDGDKVQVYIG